MHCKWKFSLGSMIVVNFYVICLESNSLVTSFLSSSEHRWLPLLQPWEKLRLCVFKSLFDLC